MAVSYRKSTSFAHSGVEVMGRRMNGARENPAPSTRRDGFLFRISAAMLPMRGRPPYAHARMRLTCGVNGSATHAERQRERWERHTWRRGANGARCEQDARKRVANGVYVAPRATCLAVRHVPCAARTGFLHYARCVRRFCTMRTTVSAKPTATSAAVTT